MRLSRTIQTCFSILLALLMLVSFVPLAFARADSVSESISVPLFDGRTAICVVDYLLESGMQTQKSKQAEIESEFIPDERDVQALARMAYGEARGVKSTTEKAACMWCVLNRMDDPSFPGTIIEVVSQPSQFTGYSENNPVTEELQDLATDVLTRYHAEQNGDENAGRVLPSEYLYFSGDGKHNYFRIHLRDKSTYTWWLESPYEN